MILKVGAIGAWSGIIVREEDMRTGVAAGARVSKKTGNRVGP